MDGERREAGREGGVGGEGYKSLQARIRVAHGMQTAELSCGGAAIDGREGERESLLLYLQVERKLGGNDTMGHGTK